jgi:ABC-type uncharacterized transport system permease subunit
MNQTQSKSKIRWLAALAIGVVAVYAYWMVGRRGGEIMRYQGQAPPSLASVGTWMNSASPLSWDSLGGQVVWLEFSFLH